MEKLQVKSKVLGEQVVMTRAVADHVESNKEFSDFVLSCLMRFANCDWGDSQSDSVELNNIAVKAWEENDEDNMQRVIAVYKTDILDEESAIWIITEWDRCYSTVLFPSDY